MATWDHAYSRAVKAAKIILPLIALTILSVLFLVARPSQKGDPIRYANDTVQTLAGEERMGRATYSSVTQDGVEVSMVASSLRPDPDVPKLTHATDLVAKLNMPDGLVYDISASTGQIDEIGKLATLQQNVEITTSLGYRMLTQVANITTDMTRLETLSPVHGDGPLGTLDAQKMVITTSPKTGNDSKVMFSGGVHLIYTPKKKVD